MNSSPNPSHEIVFPPGFLIGAATASYQIEGSPEADGKSPSIWDTFTRTEGNIADGSTGDVACDHYHRWPDDLQLVADLGLDVYRFSLSWPRIVPGGTGPVNEAGLDFYERIVDRLLELDIIPMPTLYHWDLPQVLQDDGGWVNRQTAYAFADYAQAVAERLGDRIPTFTTLNEPFVSANHGYVTGEHAPGHTSRAEGFAASHHLLLGHGLAVERLRSVAPDSRAAIVCNVSPKVPATDSDADRQLAVHVNNLENRWYTDPLDGRGYPEETADHYRWDRSEILDGDMATIAFPIDLFGVNYYTREFISADDSFELGDDVPCNTMGWEIHPPSLGLVLRELHERYSFPRYLITENGAPMPDDRRENGRVADYDRVAYLRDHLEQVHEAIVDGCPIEGYLAWSLLDNFEWAWGYGPRFGIVEVNYDTQERIPKMSAEWLSRVAKTGRMEVNQ